MAARTGRPAVWADLPVAALLVAGWFTIPAGTAGHVAVGLAFVGWVFLHGGTRRALARRLAGAVTSARVAAWSAIVTSAAMTISGVAQWAGADAMIPVHSNSSILAVVACGWHVWLRRAALRARLRRAG